MPEAKEITGNALIICLAAGKNSDKEKADRDELIVGVEGTGIIETENQKVHIKKGDSFFVQKGLRFKLENNSEKEFIFARIRGETK